MASPSIQSFGSHPHRPVWLLTIVGIGTGLMTLGTLSWSLARIQADRIAGDGIRERAAQSIRSADDSLTKTLSFSTALLDGAEASQKPNIGRWTLPFQESEISQWQKDAELSGVLEASKRLADAIKKLDQLNGKCVEFSEHVRMTRIQRRERKRAADQSLADLRASFASAEGTKLLNLAVRIREYRNRNPDQRAELGDQILSEWSPRSTQGAFMIELAELAILLERLHGEDEIDALVDIKDNRLQPSLDRLRRLIDESDQTHDRQRNEQLLVAFETKLFGVGFEKVKSHQQIVPGSRGFYSSHLDWLAAKNAKSQLEALSRSDVKNFDEARNRLLKQVEAVTRQSADNAAELVAAAWNTVAIVACLLGLAFVFLARKVSRTIGKQFDSIEEKREQLSQKTQELEASSQHLELLSLVAKYTDNSVIITDHESKIVWVNDGFERISGYSRQEVIGAEPGAIQHGEQTAPETIASMQAKLQQQEGFDVEIQHYRKSGQPYWSALEVRPIRDAEDRVVKFLWIESDITEKRQTDHNLRLLRTAVDHANDAMFAITSDGLFVDVNEMACKSLGYRYDEILNLHTKDIFANDDWQKRWHLVKQNGSLLFEQELVKRDGQGYPAEISAAYVTYDKVDYICAFARNIRDRKEAEVERQTLNEQLVDASRTAGMAEIATGVLHNVGNTLNSINVSTTIIQKQLSKSALDNLSKVSQMITEHQDDFAEFICTDNKGKMIPQYIIKVTDAMRSEREQIDNEVVDLLHNVDHIKQIIAVQQSMAVSNGMKQELAPADLVADAVTANKGSFNNHSIKIEINVDDDVPRLYSDKHKILQILVNLIKNAKDALIENAADAPSIRVAVQSDGQSILFKVIDNGIGIPPEKLDRIFQHGFTTKKTGHGFGLHSSANSAVELGGSLAVFSEGIGKGARFELSLPIDNQANRTANDKSNLASSPKVAVTA